MMDKIEWPEIDNVDQQSLVIEKISYLLKARLNIVGLNSQFNYFFVPNPPQMNFIDELLIWLQENKSISDYHCFRYGVSRGWALKANTAALFLELLPKFFKMDSNELAIIVVPNNHPCIASENETSELILRLISGEETANDVKGLVGLFFDWGELMEVIPKLR